MTHRAARSQRRQVLGGIAGGLLMGLAPGASNAAPAGKPIRIGGTLSLTGPLAQTALLHKIAGESFIDIVNQDKGILGRPVEWLLLDDQSKPEITRSLYEKLITSDKVDLIVGPYGTNSILAAMGVAQRYGKIIIQSSMGIPKLATYDMQFPAAPFGPDADKVYPGVILDCVASLPNPPKSVTILTSKFPSAQFMAEGMREVTRQRGLQVPLYLEYEFGNLDGQLPGTLRWLIERFNQRLRDSRQPGTLLLDVAALAENIGYGQWHDPVQWNLGKFPFSPAAVPLYADWLCRVIAAARGKSKKCLVLDLDNTLWGGVIGDDGLAGIVLGQGDPLGEAYLAVQAAALA